MKVNIIERKTEQKVEFKRKKGQNRDIKCARKGMLNEVYDGRKMGQNEKKELKKMRMVLAELCAKLFNGITLVSC